VRVRVRRGRGRGRVTVWARTVWVRVGVRRGGAWRLSAR
jgi:hypothetical protein